MRSLLRQVVSLPTAPLHEDAVVQFITDFARRHRLVCRRDAFGNLFVRNRGRGPLRCTLMAHMDHPGFVVQRSRATELVARIRGGLFRPHLRGAKVRFFLPSGTVVRGRILQLIDENHVRVRVAQPVPIGSFGMLDLPPVQIRGQRVQARVIDNLANVATILDWLRHWRRSTIKVMGVFTRAEEIGLYGAAHVVRQGSLSKRVPLIVLEASSAKVARVQIGGGPVIRVGDRLIGFDPRIDAWLHVHAQRLATRDGRFRFQRALMTGGRMEASLFVLTGYLVGSLALPLGNYHNRGPRGPAPEIIDWRDWVNLGKLLDALVRGPSVRAVTQRLQRQWMPRRTPT